MAGMLQVILSEREREREITSELFEEIMLDGGKLLPVLCLLTKGLRIRGRRLTAD